MSCPFQSPGRQAEGVRDGKPSGFPALPVPSPAVELPDPMMNVPAPKDVTNRADQGHSVNPSVMSSPDWAVERPWEAPTMPPSRRVSNADSSTTEMVRVKSNVSDITASVVSEGTAAMYAEADRALKKLILEEEPAIVKKEPVENIPTSLPTEHKSTPFNFSCHFGWSGDEAEDLTDMPSTKAAFLARLNEAKDGVSFVKNGMSSYQDEINRGRHHEFNVPFIKHQNEAALNTRLQLNTINKKLDEVAGEVEDFSDDDADIEEKLTVAYKHAAPWIKRTQRIVGDAHVWYKLNYTMQAANTAANTAAKSRVKTHVSLFNHFYSRLIESKTEALKAARNGKS
jgi:hypothetical protein